MPLPREFHDGRDSVLPIFRAHVLRWLERDFSEAIGRESLERSVTFPSEAKKRRRLRVGGRKGPNDRLNDSLPSVVWLLKPC